MSTSSVRLMDSNDGLPRSKNSISTLLSFLSAFVFLAGKYYSALDGTDMNYGGEDNGMGLTMGLGGMAGLGNYSDTADRGQ